MNKIYDRLLSLLARVATQKSIFILTGIAATLWFLLRVIPKPQRATYPCMRAAAPIMSAFVCYALSLFGILGSLKLLKLNLKRAKYVPALACMGAFAVALVAFNVQNARESWAAFSTTPSGLNVDHDGGGAIGTAQGIVPGRVVWVWDDRATNNNHSTYFQEENNDQYVIDRMFMAAVISVAGEDGAVGDSKNIVTAWDKIFTHFNNTYGTRFNEPDRLGRGYQAGEKVFIKVNNTSLYDGNSGSNNYYTQRATSELVESNAFTLLALIKHLVEYVGVAPSNIYVGDPHRGFHSLDKTYIEKFYPSGITYPTGTLNPCAEQVIHYSGYVGDISSLPNATKIDDKHFKADYIFNIPAIKGHGSGGFSATAKNFFGCIMNLHHYTNTILHPALPDQINTADSYYVLADLMASKHLGQKTVLYIADALYTGKGNDWNGKSNAWDTPPFNRGGTAKNPSSLFMSLDPVALETVCYDFLRQPASNIPTVAVKGVDEFLHHIALPSAHRPSTGYYNPDGDKPLTYSLGVHEHGDPLGAGYSDPNGIKLVSLKSSAIAESNISWSSISIEDLVNYPTTTDVIEVKKTANGAPSQAEWDAVSWRRMDYQYLEGDNYVKAYEGWQGLNIKSDTYAGLYKYLYNPNEKEMYVLAKIKDDSFVPAVGAVGDDYWKSFDILEVFYAPTQTSGTPAVSAATGYAQHISVGAPTGGVYPVNHVIDVPSGGWQDYYGETLSGGNIVKSGQVTLKADGHYYWELTLDISGAAAKFNGNGTVKFSMTYNDIDAGKNRTGQYGSVYLADAQVGDGVAPYQEIASYGTIKLSSEQVETDQVFTNPFIVEDDCPGAEADNKKEVASSAATLPPYPVNAGGLSWTVRVEDTPDWITAQKDGNNIIVTIQENTTNTSRTAYVVIELDDLPKGAKASNGTSTKAITETSYTLKITQAAAPIAPCIKPADKYRTICATRAGNDVVISTNNDDPIERIVINNEVVYESGDTLEPSYPLGAMPSTVEICTNNAKLIKKFWQ